MVEFVKKMLPLMPDDEVHSTSSASLIDALCEQTPNLSEYKGEVIWDHDLYGFDDDHDDNDDLCYSCPCNPAYWDRLLAEEAAEVSIATLGDFYRSGRATTRENMLREKAARRKGRGDRNADRFNSATPHATRSNGRKSRKQTNRQQKRTRTIPTEIGFDYMPTKYGSWSFLSNVQASQTFRDYADPYADLDTVYGHGGSGCYCGFRDGAEEIYPDSHVTEDVASETSDAFSLDEEYPTYRRDLRSWTRSKNRERKQRVKYYSFRASRPEWVDTLYYDVTLTVPKATDTTICSRRSNWKRRKVTQPDHKEEVEDSRLFAQFHLPYDSWQSYELSAAVSAAGKIADTQYDISERAEGTVIASPILDKLLEYCRNCDAGFWECHRGHKKLLYENPSARLRLKVKKWTKKDNFHNSTNFDKYWYIGRRHHSRKVTWDEKHYRSHKMRELDRNMKNRSRRLDATGEPVNGFHSKRLWCMEDETSYVCKWEESLHGIECPQANGFPSLQAIGEEDPKTEADKEHEEESPFVLENIEDTVLRSTVPPKEVCLLTMQNDEVHTIVSELSVDDWVLFADDASEISNGTEMYRLSDLDEILVESDWDTLSIDLTSC